MAILGVVYASGGDAIIPTLELNRGGGGMKSQSKNYVLGRLSLARLNGVHPDLASVVKRAIEMTTQDFSVLEGVRSDVRQRELYGQGRTAAELRAAGVDPALAKPSMQEVAWTLKSNHFKQEDGYGHAVDLVPYPLDWNNLAKFDAIADAMMRAADQLGVAIRHGADWNQNGKRREKGETDNPHFELVMKGRRV
jgi:peptidoglycan LD-endopeptidase CwlK